jgi:methyl-accepting chemotaxis protein
MSNLQSMQSNGTVLGIRGRLLIGFGLITVIFLIATFFTLITTHNTKTFTQRVITIEMPYRNAFVDLGIEIDHAKSTVQSILLLNVAEEGLTFEQIWKNINELEVRIDNYTNTYQDAAASSKWQQIKPLLMKLHDTQSKILSHANDIDKTNALNILKTEAIPIENNIDDLVDGPININGVREGGLYDSLQANMQADANKVIDDIGAVTTLEIAISIIGVIASLLVALFTARGIMRHINVFRQYSSQIASGDLRQTLKIFSNDEIGKLGEDLNIMTESLAGITKQITTACHSMVTTIEEIKQSVNVQSSGATEQASSINEITASLEEIEKSSAQTMEKAKTLGDAAERTREKGQEGLEAVEQSILGMKGVRDKVQMIAQSILDLSNQTQQVGEITAVVNTLAQQSKMLALNASIEAAKAGEAGKGFAVVAAEVKNLAEQSEQSTAQVQKILEDIRHAAEKAVMVTEEGTKGVDHGTSLVEQTGGIVRNLTQVIHETTIASQQIEAAVRQEGVGIEQITAGMNEINQVTSSFVASVKQTTEAISNLSTIAKSLKEQIDTYKT